MIEASQRNILCEDKVMASRSGGGKDDGEGRGESMRGKPQYTV